MLRPFKKQLTHFACSFVPLKYWHILRNINLVIPLWHVVSDYELPHISGLYQFRNVKEFKNDLEFFLSFYAPVGLNDIINHLDGVKSLPKHCVLFTFDDGFREIHDVVEPILYQKGIPAVFFLMTSVIDNQELCYPQKKSLLIRALSKNNSLGVLREVTAILGNQGFCDLDLKKSIRNIYYRQRHLLDSLAIVLDCDYNTFLKTTKPYLKSVEIKKLLKNGFDIGAHSIDHPLYSELNIEEQLRQTKESINWLSKKYHFECQAFAFPYRDKDISINFFNNAFADGHLKVSFGTSGLGLHYFKRNYARFSMENTSSTAARILGYQFCRSLFHR